ncbi:glycosyltransferase family A protein [Clostridium tagluense]|uniref:Glycosyltransferase 2-like domain-containing protein n=1 Tax=Clostridium tagluense TaxID=360422 RepID=A0A401UNA1_9CLOT|nr:glycosyltransferase family A protein [Clostridium tagluense]GCD10981.1 hypothetical protein Ctaglu_26040 [Clostridium tagluense]
MEKKVSIITPCLNGEKFAQRYLESVLNQTYKNIELIFINDGSTDKTEAVVKSYINKFQQNGMNLTYIFQENAGQAAALNVGLKLFTGEYLTWPDSDDFLSIDSIEKKVDFLEKNKQYGLVRTDAYIFNEGEIIKSIGTIAGKNPNRFNENIFEDLLSEDTYCWNGCYMLRTSAFLDVNPKGEIYASTAGQNFQMLLPIAYKYKCGYIDESLYNYVVRNDSHSHLDENINLQTSLMKNSNHENILLNVINSMEVDKAFYSEVIIAKYARRKMALALTYKNKEILVQQYEVLRKMGLLNMEDKITYARGLSFVFNLFYRIISKTTRIVRNVSKQLPWRY